jgi:voltage-gated sodium channel
MRRVVGALFAAIPGLGSVIAIIGVIFYVAAVMATQLYGERFPEWFGHLGASAYTLFQVMTLESWSMGIVRPIMEVYPYSWLFFLPFILIATFTMLNLFIAVIVNAIQTHADRQQDRTVTALANVTRAADRHVYEQLARIEGELRSLRERMSGYSADARRAAAAGDSA